jgi:transcriptional regulator of acetoin/glycerol metabolism
MADDGTISVDDPAVVRAEGVPWLIRTLCCDAPLARPARISLADCEVATLGRGELGETTLAGERTSVELAILVADHRMSTQHARIVRDGRLSTIEDLGSKNGTLVNGQRCDRRELTDGDVIETGHTFFVYRTSAPADLGAGPAWIGGGAHGGLPLTTFVPSLARHYETLEKIAASMVPVVVLGETGTGKEVVARALHRMSGRTGEFVAINCGAIPANLVESELFGSKRGAFSGANEDRIGLVRTAEGGTLFLDEIGELPQAAQVALLRVLQESEVMPVGGTKPVKIDIRVVAATHRPLDQLVDTGGFRSDLFARLTGFNVRLPPLRERREDYGLIVAGLIRRIAVHPDRVRISLQAGRAIFSYAFPRNIRELEKALGLALAVVSHSGGDVAIELDDLPEELRAPTSSAPVAVSEDDQRRAQLVALLVQHHGRIADVARAMGKARMQIHRWLQRYGIDIETYRK